MINLPTTNPNQLKNAEEFTPKYTDNKLDNQKIINLKTTKNENGKTVYSYKISIKDNVSVIVGYYNDYRNFTRMEVGPLTYLNGEKNDFSNCIIYKPPTVLYFEKYSVDDEKNQTPKYHELHDPNSWEAYINPFCHPKLKPSFGKIQGGIEIQSKQIKNHHYLPKGKKISRNHMFKGEKIYCNTSTQSVKTSENNGVEVISKHVKVFLINHQDKINLQNINANNSYKAIEHVTHIRIPVAHNSIFDNPKNIINYRSDGTFKTKSKENELFENYFKKHIEEIGKEVSKKNRKKLKGVILSPITIKYNKDTLYLDPKNTSNYDCTLLIAATYLS